MITHELLADKGIVIVTPKGPLEATDFQTLTNLLDPLIKEQGPLNGVLIYTPSFPGWRNFAAAKVHLTFIKNHHRHIKKVAAVTDSRWLAMAPYIANCLLQPKVKRFHYTDKEAALNWIVSTHE